MSKCYFCGEDHFSHECPNVVIKPFEKPRCVCEDVIPLLHKKIERLRKYIKHLETCDVCSEGFYGMCEERNELQRRAKGE